MSNDATAEWGRFSEPALLVMTSLAGGPKHGYAMLLDIASFQGAQLRPATLYGAIARLEERGWIEALPVQDRRKAYRLTASGATVLEERLNNLRQFTATGLQRLATT